MRYTKMILAGILALTLTACSNTGTTGETTVLSETTSDTLLTEENSATEETTTEAVQSETTQAATVTDTETEISNEPPVLAEDIYGLDSALNADTINFNNLPEFNAPYLLWQSENGVSVYGIRTDEVTASYGEYEEYAELVIIRHDNMIETLDCKWLGRALPDPMNVMPFNEQENIIFGTVVNETGTGTLVENSVLFALNSAGCYEMFELDNDKILSSIESKVNVDVDNSSAAVIFNAGGEKYTIDVSEFGEEFQQEDICIYPSYCTYTCGGDEKIQCTAVFSEGMFTWVAYAEASITFSNGTFTVEDIRFLSDKDILERGY